MENKALYLLAQFDDETNKILNEYNHQLSLNNFVGTQTKNIPYHITLANYNCSCEFELINKLIKISKKSKIINLKLNHLGLFGLNVLFVTPIVNYELLSLYKNFQGSDDENWTPHVTMLIDEQDNILKALPILNNSFKPINAKIVSLSLYEFFPARKIIEVNLNNELKEDDLLINLDKLHTTVLGEERIRKNLFFETNNVVLWCKEKIKNSNNIILKGKNYYVDIGNYIITINANNYSIITAHKK